MHQPADAPTKRPFSVTLLAVLVLFFTLLNILRFSAALRLHDFLSEPFPGVPVGYLAATGAFWALVGLPLALGLFFGRAWSLDYGRVVTGLYTVYYWIEHLCVVDSRAIVSRLPFAIGLSIALLVFSFWTLAQPRARMFLRSPEKS